MMEIPLTQHLAAFCTQLDYESLPAEVVDRAKYFFLDYLGVAVRGSLSDSSQPLYRMANSLASAGRGTVLGRLEKVDFPYAALANGTSAHSLELDDTHQAGSIHLGVSVFSAALAVAEQVGASGKDFLTASVVGFEVAARLAMALKPAEHYGRGFHPTATCGTFGAAASAAKLLGLSEAQLVSALGIAGSQSAGSMEFLAEGCLDETLPSGLGRVQRYPRRPVGKRRLYWSAHDPRRTGRLSQSVWGAARAEQNQRGVGRGFPDSPYRGQTARLLPLHSGSD